MSQQLIPKNAVLSPISRMEEDISASLADADRLIMLNSHINRPDRDGDF